MWKVFFKYCPIFFEIPLSIQEIGVKKYNK